MGQLEFEGMGNPPPPDDDDAWATKWVEVSELFSPTAPVEESDLFAGRQNQLARLVDVVYQRGQHGIVYGDRGVGKTSLINTYQKKVFPSVSIVRFFSTRCLTGDNFVTIWERAFNSFQWENGDYAADDIDSSVTPYTILSLANRFRKSVLPVFIFDEFDRITDADTKLKMAETIKLLSDESSSTTIVIVGIGRTIRDLLSEHESVRRALRQVQMPRMSRDEIREIITVRLKRVAMTISERALNLIVNLAKGMPGYAHLVGMHSTRQTLNRKSMQVEFEDVGSMFSTIIEEAGESTRQDYAKAVQSAKPNNQFREVLLACALAPPDDFGAFTAAAIRDPISNIIGEPKDIPAFARHLTAFCSEERGPILEKDGTPKNYRFRFIDPMMQPYIVTKGLSDGIIEWTDEGLKFNPRK